MAELFVGNTVLVLVDVQKGGDGAIPHMDGGEEAGANILRVLAAARAAGIPRIFFQEAHRRSMVDFGRELDGVEKVHLLEGDRATELRDELERRPDEPLIVKRRYSCFFGTDLEILLKGLKTETLILVGGLTDVCVHYTFVDAHQHDYRVRVVEDACTGSSFARHDAALDAMEYLQTGARRMTDEVVTGLAAGAATAQRSVATSSTV